MGIAAPQRRVWHKHIFAFFRAAATQWAQILFALLVLLFGDHVALLVVGRPLDLRAELGIAVVISGVWTTVHLLNELRRERAKKEEDKTPLGRRRAILAKMTAPVQLLVAVVNAALSLGMSLLIIVLSLSGRPALLWIPIASYYLFLLGWLGIEFVDWYNDQYILTEDRIIDITRVPIIYMQSTEAPLAMVQNATTSQKGLGVIFDYGDVVVETAGAARPILFEQVWRPRMIQEAIFNQIDAANKRRHQREREALAAQTQRWLEVYHTLAQGIRDIQYDHAVAPGQTVRVRWFIQGPAGRYYRTWLVWDTVSHAQDATYYAYQERADGQPWYTASSDYDGQGERVHHARGLRAPADKRAMYFRVVVWFEGEELAHSSPEMIISIRPAAPADR